MEEEYGPFPSRVNFVAIRFAVFDGILTHQALAHGLVVNIGRVVLQALKLLPVYHLCLKPNKRDRVQLARVRIAVPSREDNVWN